MLNLDAANCKEKVFIINIFFLLCYNYLCKVISVKHKITLKQKIKNAIKYFKRHKKHKRRKLKKSVKLFLYITLILIIILFLNKGIKIKNVLLDNDKIHIKLSNDKNISCILTNDNKTPTLDSEEWIKAKNNECIFDYDNNKHNLYIKNKDKIIYKNKKSIIYNFKFENEKEYYPTYKEYTLKYSYDYIGKNPKINWYTSNPNIIKVNDGKINLLKDGNAIIEAQYNNTSTKIEIISTSLIVEKPKEFDFKKKFLPCEKYSVDENDLLDEILYYKAHSVGFKTRASAVEVARFLTLEFPYRINYFNENGRITQNNKIDAEGRYYHIGLYLNESRFDNISKSTRKPKIWGCSLYSEPMQKAMDNGLDCSGFVSWVLLNAGFDVGDIGAGFADDADLTDIGKLTANNKSLLESNKIKVGDLLHSYKAGGHIAIIVGIDSNYYYVAQALWYDERGVIITKETKESLLSEFPHVILMDSYYNDDGNLTNMWY